MASYIDRAFGRVFLLALLLIATCVSCDSCDGKEAYVLPQACKRAFIPVLESYEAAMGVRVPAKCIYLDKTYDIAEIAEDISSVCKQKHGTNEAVGGCVLEPDTIVIQGGRDNIQMTESAVHEWFHVLLLCHTGQIDEEHMQGKLWYPYLKEESAEGRAHISAEPGRCL